MENMNVQQILLNKVAEHVSNEFGLDEAYRITNFKAKDTSITMDSVNYEVTIKCKGQASEDIHQAVYKIERELRKENEEAEEIAE